MKTIGILLFAVAACGGGGGDDDDIQPGDPRLIAGGGVTDGPISGTLHVHAVEVDSSTPIANATVTVGAATGTTNSAGLASFTGVEGDQTVTVTAPGHAAATWIGVGGANVTVPLSPTTRTIPTASVTGTIAGWDNLPGPAFGNYTLAVILYSFLDDPAAPENSIAQPMSNGAPLDTCIRSAVSNSCSWTLSARVGKQIHSAVIVEGDTNGTTDDISDDSYTFKGFAIGEVMTLTAGQQVTNESLRIVAANELKDLSITLPAAPAGLTNVVAIPELSLGDAGRVVFPLPTLTGSGTAKVLANTGDYAGSYELVALATPSATAKAPFSSTFVHDVTGSAAATAWLAPPTGLAAGATFAFTDASGSAFRTAQITRGTNVVWDITILDGSTTFTLPTLTPDPLGSGMATFAVSAADVPSFDRTDFDVPAVKTGLVRAAGAQLSFTP